MEYDCEDGIEEDEEGVEVERDLVSNYLVSHTHSQVDISDGGASDGSLPSKKKKRRVLFSKVNYHGPSKEIISTVHLPSKYDVKKNSQRVKTKSDSHSGPDLRIGTSVPPAALLERP